MNFIEQPREQEHARMVPPRQWLVALLLLVISWASLWSLKASHGTIIDDVYDHTISEVAVRILPRQVRDLVAGYLWLTADEYIHFGPSKINAGRFVAGSYAGNLEILPVLEMALFFDPTRIDAYAILARNLSLFLPRFQDGIRLLQRGVFYNRNDPQLHELYTELAFNFGFVQDYRSDRRNNRAIGLKYLDAAIRAYDRTNGGKVKTLSIWRPENIRAIQARWLMEAGEKERAMEALNAAGLAQALNEPLSRDILNSIGTSVASLLPARPASTASETNKSSPSGVQAAESDHSEATDNAHGDDEHQQDRSHSLSSSAREVLLRSAGLAAIAGFLFFISVSGYRKPSAKKQ
ncbi:MAG: hypothetical protein ACOYM3_00125 [Terrimicrobiaceae bacterium]